MQRKLRLVKDVNYERERAAAVEDQYRYPPQEDIWEVSCGEWEKDEKPVLTTGRRRAS